MNEKITTYLSKLEKEHGIEILLACETGSRAWGFPSPDSDYDVRIIYKHPKNWYLSLEEQKDTIEIMLENNDIDITGWDLRKSLQLLRKSNAALLERIQSPIVYKVDQTFLEGMTSVATNCYSKIGTMHHYLSMAKKTMEDIEGVEEYKLKKFFYALRASVACLWILEKNEIPPIEFPKMIHGLSFEESLKNRIFELIEIKSTIAESYMHKGEKQLIEFMHDCLERADSEFKSLSASKPNLEDLNAFFISQLQ